MKDSKKTKNQLIAELQEMRQRLELKDTAASGGSEGLFSKAFRASPDMMIITSIPEGKYLEVNDAFSRNTGYPREELIGASLEDRSFFVSPEEQERMLEILRTQGNFRGEEFTFRVRSGEIQRWLCSGEIVNINGKTRMISVATDITKRKKMEEALSESKQILAIAFQASPQAIGISTLKDGKFIDVNYSQERLSGYTREELIGHSADDLNMWSDPKDSHKIWRLMQKNERVSNEELVLRKKNGQLYPVLFSAQILTLRSESCVITSLTDLTERAGMERALRESEEKFSKAFSSSPNAVCIFSVKDSKFIEVNDSFVRFSGYSRNKIIGHTPDDLNLWVYPDERDQMATILQAKGKLINEKFHSRTKTGDIRTGMFSAQAFDMNGEPHMILSINDITNQEKAEDAIANEAILRRVLIQNSRDGITILDRNGKVFEANRKYCEMLGYTPKEMKNLNVWDWDTRWNKEELMKQIDAIDEVGDHFETRHKRKDGTIIDVEISTNGATIGGDKLVFCVCRDITKRKQMENALRESEEMFSKAFHANPEVTSITTINEGRYIDVNVNYTKYLGYSREELIGHTIKDLGIWAKPAERANMYKTLKEDGEISNKQYSFRTKSGVIRTWMFSAVPVTIGEEPCLLEASIDITEQIIIEAQAREAANLKELERLRRELLANVSHELRTPLASIKGFTTMLIDYNKRLKSTEKMEYLKTIDNNADRMVEMIEQLLEMSRLGSGMMAIRRMPTDIARLCRGIIATARKNDPELVFILELPRRLPKISIDAERIRQVLAHLIGNAAKYSKPGQEITLNVRRTPYDMLFILSDHGPGIPKEDIPYIFDRMFTLKMKSRSATSGSGLGLSFCKGLIDAHNGRIWFESEEGVGSKCLFTLPLKPEAAASEETSSEPEAPQK